MNHQCSGCHAIAYCMRQCHRKDYHHHQEIYKAIRDAEERVYNKLIAMFECNLTTGKQTECTIKCSFNDKHFEAL